MLRKSLQFTQDNQSSSQNEKKALLILETSNLQDIMLSLINLANEDNDNKDLNDTTEYLNQSILIKTKLEKARKHRRKHEDAVLALDSTYTALSTKIAAFEEKKRLLEQQPSYESSPSFLHCSQALDAVSRERGKIEDEILKKDPSWNEFTKKIYEFDREFNKLIREAQNIVKQNNYKLIIDALAKKNVDIVLYDAPDLEGYRISYDISKIQKALQSLDSNVNYDFMTIGGGHGSPTTLSGLAIQDAEALCNKLKEKNITGNVILLGSCESSIHACKILAILGKTKNSLAIGAVGDCANTFFALETINYVLGQSSSLLNEQNYLQDYDVFGTTLGLLYNNTMTVFDLPKEKQIQEYSEKFKFWSSSLHHLYTDFASKIGMAFAVQEEKAQDNFKKVIKETPHISFLRILSEKNNTTISPRLLLGEKSKYYYENANEDLGNSVNDNIEKKFKNTFGAAYPKSDKEAFEQAFPKVIKEEFSTDPQNRITAINLIVSLASSIQQKNELTKGLAEDPINEKLRARSLKKPGSLSESDLENNILVKEKTKIQTS